MNDTSFAPAKKRRTLSPEHKAKLSAKLKGRRLSQEHRAKLSVSLRRKPVESTGGEIFQRFPAVESQDLAPQPERHGIWDDIFHPSIPSETLQPKRKRGRPRIHNLPKLPENKRLHKLGDNEPDKRSLTFADKRQMILLAQNFIADGISINVAISRTAEKFEIDYATTYSIVKDSIF